MDIGAKFPYVPGIDCVGRVVLAGKGAQALMGRRVNILMPHGTWAEYIPSNMQSAIPVDEDVPVSSAAYGFTNPFTAIGLIETVKAEKRKGFVLDAAASTLGRMINNLARKEKIPVINVVAKKEQEALLRKEGV